MNNMIYMCKRVGVAMLLLSVANNINLQVVNGAFTSLSKPSSHRAMLSPFQSSSTINQVNSKFMGRGMKLQQASIQKKNNNRRGGMSMFLGQDGILGVGAPELVSSDLKSLE